MKMSTTACTAAGCFVKFTAHRLNQPYRFGLTAAARGRAFLRDRFWVAVAPMALAKSRSERSPKGRSGKGRGGEGSCDEHCGGEGRSGKAVPKAELSDAR